jgi:hypothetical protein
VIEKIIINQVESGYEPEIFKEQFKEGWSNYDHSILNIGDFEDSDEETKDGEIIGELE